MRHECKKRTHIGRAMLTLNKEESCFLGELGVEQQTPSILVYQFYHLCWNLRQRMSAQQALAAISIEMFSDK